MKKPILICLIVSFFYGCDSSNNQSAVEHKAELDSFTMKKYGRNSDDQAKYAADSIMNKARNDDEDKNFKAALKAPVLIKKCYISKSDYGSKSINIKVLNNSNKKINGIKIRWLLYNNFGDQLDVNRSGISQDILSPKKSDTYSWDLYSTTATSAKAYVYSVHFIDGTIWQLPDIN
jgi:hypothetical protein